MTKPQIYIGPAGWSYPDWNGVVYPRRKPARFDPLEFLSSYFNLIEINNTFYRVPERDVSARWADRVADREDFLFTVKAFRGFTHDKSPASESDITLFKRAIEPLHESGRLGVVLIQFPWSFRHSDDTRRYVHRLTQSLSPFPAVVEVRHGGWGSSAAVSFFRDNDITLCGIDQPAIGDSLGPDMFAPGKAGAYFRLHGRNREEWFKRDSNRDRRYNYLYTRRELSHWRKRIEEVSNKPGRVFAVLNNHFRGQAVANAFELRSMLAGGKVDAPPEVIENYPHLADAARPKTRGLPRSSPPRSEQPSLFQDENDEHNDEQADGDG
jgi:uncharacterized protein YecE (DUF72 family)